MSAVEITNVGPVEKLSLPIPEDGGVVLLTGANGSGKTHSLEAVQSLASGQGKLPVRDGAKLGSVEGFGARIGISRSTRRTGELAVTSLTGKLDISALITPDLKDPAAADAKRIKALVSLSGCKVDPSMFYELLGGQAEVEAIVPKEVFDLPDPVAIVEHVKRDIESHARQAKTLYDHESGHAKGAREAVADVKLPMVIDNVALQKAHEAAVQRKTQLEEQRKAYEQSWETRTETHKKLEKSREEYAQELTESEAEKAVDAKKAVYLQSCEQQKKLHDELAALEARMKGEAHELDKAMEQLKTATERRKVISNLEETLAKLSVVEIVEDAELDAAQQAVNEAQKAIEEAAIAQRAADKLADAEAHEKAAQDALEKHDRLRAAAKSCDEVLSKLVGSNKLRVQAGRLVLDTDRGEEYYSDLSDGERVKVAVDIAVDRLHELGQKPLLVLPQRNWQDLDPAARKEVHLHAKARGVVIISAECTDGELKAEEFVA